MELVQPGDGGGTVVSTTYSADISSQCNGTNKIFTIPANTGVLLLTCTDAPVVYKPNIDFTVSGTILTMTSQVNAPSLGSTLIVIYQN